MNTMITLFAGLALGFESTDADSARRVRRVYESARRQDLYFTHTFVYPFKDHSQPLGDNATALRVVRESAEGIVVSGARGLATGAAFADQNFNLERVRAPGPGAAQVRRGALALVRGAGRRSGPEMALPRRRSVGAEPVRLHRSPASPTRLTPSPSSTRSSFRRTTSSATPMTSPASASWPSFFAPWAEQLTKHQALVRFVAKTRFLLGLAHLVAESSGSARYVNVQQRLGDIVLCLDVLESLAIAAIEDPTVDPATGWYRPSTRFSSGGVRFFGEHYPRMLNHLLMLGASRYMSTPQERTLDVLGDAIDRYFRGSAPNAKRKRQPVPDRLGAGWLHLRLAPGPLRTLLRQRLRAAEDRKLRHDGQALGHRHGSSECCERALHPVRIPF